MFRPGDEADHPGTDITIATPSFGQQVASLVGSDTPLQENAGMPGFTSGDTVAHLAGWLEHVASRYVTINLGTNDAAGGIAPAAFYTNMQQLVQAVTSAGKIPVVPTIPYSTEPIHLANTPVLNAQIAALYKANPAVVAGPDLWSFFKNNPRYLSSDHVHPSAQGCVAYRTLWAQFAATAIYPP
jgi:lysophospholipase L1-like esterase